MTRSAYAGVFLLMVVAVLATWWRTNGLETSAPYPATYFWCGAESAKERQGFMVECLSTVQSRYLDRKDMIPWCAEMSLGIYCRPEPGFRYSRLHGQGPVEQTEIESCKEARSRSERLVCGQVDLAAPADTVLSTDD